jgi:hypothetical protein
MRNTATSFTGRLVSGLFNGAVRYRAQSPAGVSAQGRNRHGLQTSGTLPVACGERGEKDTAPRSQHGEHVSCSEL